MSKHPLEVIERLIDVELHARAYTREELESSFIPALNKELGKLLCEPHHILRLMDTIARDLLVEGYQLIFSCLRRRYLKMLEVFIDHKDIDLQVPSFYFEIDEEKIKATLRLFRDRLSDEGVDGELWGFFRQMFSVLFSENSDLLSYRQYAYLMKMLGVFDKLLSKHNIDFSDELKSYLIDLNFNDARYVELCRKEIDAIPAIHERVIRLYHLRNRINLIFGRSAVGYQPSQPSLKAQLLEWIIGEIKLLESDPRELVLSALDPETSDLIRFVSQMNMSQRQVKRFLKIIIDKDYYRENKEKVDYLFSTYCLTVPEDNPAIDEALKWMKIAHVAVKLKLHLLLKR
jgi:hypothetical protein